MPVVTSPVDNPEQKRRVLLAEDSSVVQDLLLLILAQRGHEVDIYPDGQSALDALYNKHYDVALIDFHLPIMDGMEVINRYLARADKVRPYFVAITGDVKGLLANRTNCEKFDKVLPKPLDVDQVCDVVEHNDAVDVKWETNNRQANTSSVRHLNYEKSPIDSLDSIFFHWPPATMDHVAASDITSSYDAVIVHNTNGLDTLWNIKGIHLLPVIDLTGQLGGKADATIIDQKTDNLEAIELLIDGFSILRKQIHRDLVQSVELSDKLLGRMYVSGGALEPKHNPLDRSFVSYNSTLKTALAGREIQALKNSNLVDLNFFDRLHVCGNCESSRLNPREECPSCNSPNLTEKSYIHHFRCAYQGPETDFQHDDELLCPKCRRTLNHFGNDYDRPGTVLSCNACGHSSSEPQVGFLCMDCGTHMDGDTIATKDVFKATISDFGVKYLQAGPMFLGMGQRTLRFADLPLDLVVRLNQAAKKFNENQSSFSLTYIGYNFALEAEIGSRMFTQSRTLYLEGLRQHMPTTSYIAQGPAYDFVLTTGVTPEEGGKLLQLADHAAMAPVRVDLEKQFQHFGPSDIA